MTTETLDAEGFRALVRKSMVTCALCGHKDYSLTRHLREEHNMTPGAYQKQYPKDQYPDARIFSPVLGELLKNLNRAPRTSPAFEDQLPMYEAKDGLTKDIITMCKDVPRPAPGVEGLMIPDINPNFYFDETATPKLAAGLVAGMNVYLAGPTGCGKTDLCYQLHANIQKPIVRLNLNGDASRATLVGEMRASTTKGTYFHYGALPTAMRNGSTLLLDEVDYGPPHILAVCNSVLEGNRVIYIEETGETITAQPGFTIVATGNTGGKGDLNGNYTGTEVLNTAFLDRFAVKITMAYLPEDREIAMLRARFPKIVDAKTKAEFDDKRIETLVKFATEVRTAFTGGKLSMTVSTRKLIEMLRLTQMLGFEAALSCGIMDWLDKDDTQLVEGLKTRVGL